MSLIGRRRIRGLLGIWGIALLAVLGLVAFGSQATTLRTYSLEAPNYLTVAHLHSNSTVCEGPIASDTRFRGLGIWGAATTKTAKLRVVAEDPASRRVLATGYLVASDSNREYTARLDRSVAGERPVRICVTGLLNTFALSGSGTQHANIVMTGEGSGGSEFSLVLLSNSHRSLLGSLSTAFARASLWRPSWVGSWTFWVLSVGLLASFVLGAIAVTRAALDDEDQPDGDRPAGS